MRTIRCNTTGIAFRQIFRGSLIGTLGLFRAVSLFIILSQKAQSHDNRPFFIKSTWDSVYICQS